MNSQYLEVLRERLDDGAISWRDVARAVLELAERVEAVESDEANRLAEDVQKRSEVLQRIEAAVKRVEVFDRMMKQMMEAPFFKGSSLAGIYHRRTCEHCGGHLDDPR